MIRQVTAFLAKTLPSFVGKNYVLRNLLSASAGQPGFVVRRGGVNYEIIGSDLLDYYLVSGTSEAQLIVARLAIDIGSSSACLWDIGANLGSVSLPLLRACPNLTAVLFEPNPATCARLLRNLELNPDLSRRAKVLPVALSNVKEWRILFNANAKGNSGIGTLLATDNNEEQVGPMIEVRRGDDLSTALPLPEFVKIDVEGFEFEVLQGLGAMLDSVKTIIFEHSTYMLCRRQMALNAVSDLLQDKGYTISTLHHNSVDLSIDDDLIAVRTAN